MANTFNISGALKGMEDPKLVHNKSTGNCARSVRSFIERGGISTKNHPSTAKQYTKYLPSIGFSPIATVTGKDNLIQWSNLKALVGDIAVMEHGKYGHICMWDGKLWVSDFKQQNMYPYEGDGKATIYRFRSDDTNNNTSKTNKKMTNEEYNKWLNDLLEWINPSSTSSDYSSTSSNYSSIYEPLESNIINFTPINFTPIKSTPIKSTPIKSTTSKYFSTYLPVFAKKGKRLIPKILNIKK